MQRCCQGVTINIPPSPVCPQGCPPARLRPPHHLLWAAEAGKGQALRPRSPYPALQGVAGLQVRRAGSVTLL